MPYSFAFFSIISIIRYKIYDIIPKTNIEVITKFRLNTCDPYVIRYPNPFFDTNNSPIITPINDKLIFIFRVLIKLLIFPLKISFVKI